MDILRNIQINRNLWQNLCDESEYVSPFQTPQFYDFINSVNGYCADAFAIEENEGLSSIMVVTIQKEKGIKSYFSKRGIIYGGPLVKSGYEGSFVRLLHEVVKFYRGKLIYLEIRNYFDYSFLDAAYRRAGFKWISWLNFQIKVESVENLKKSMSSSRWRQIKKSINSGATWKVADKVEEIVEYYKILEDLYRKKIKKPLFPIEFFIKFFEQNLGVFLIVMFNNQIIGGIVCPVLREKSIYEFYVCGLDKEFKDQYPSVMATWAALEYAANNKIKMFDFMGAGNPDSDYGVREFKSRFGGLQVNHGRYLYLVNPLLYKTGSLALRILSIIK